MIYWLSIDLLTPIDSLLTYTDFYWLRLKSSIFLELSNAQVRREGGKWEAGRLATDTLFILGSRANKALGFGQTRGRLYIKVTPSHFTCRRIKWVLCRWQCHWHDQPILRFDFKILLSKAGKFFIRCNTWSCWNFSGEQHPHIKTHIVPSFRYLKSQNSYFAAPRAV